MGETYIKMLIARNLAEKPKIINGLKFCPNCEEYIHEKKKSTDLNTYKFCPQCGKRLDLENRGNEDEKINK